MILRTTIDLPPPSKYVEPKGIKLKKGYSYAYFPVKGDSMTDKKNKYSIPSGSLVLTREVNINSIWDYPFNTPVLIMGVLNERPYNLCKTISMIDDAFRHSIELTSYNLSYKPFWLPLSSVQGVFIIEQITRPGKKKPINIKHNY